MAPTGVCLVQVGAGLVAAAREEGGGGGTSGLPPPVGGHDQGGAIVVDMRSDIFWWMDMWTEASMSDSMIAQVEVSLPDGSVGQTCPPALGYR